MKRNWAAQKAALATVRRFNAANGKAWFWPKIAAALVSKHHWLIIARDACDAVVDREVARPGGLDPCRLAWRSMPALQRPWPSAHHCVGAASIGLKA
jgi:hypothetical protein